MITRIDTKTARLRLKPRREPYWLKLTTGAHIGFRRTATGGTWLARYRPVNGKRIFETFGELYDIDPADQFEAAQKNAFDWIAGLGLVSAHGYTLGSVIKDYTKELKKLKGSKTADQTNNRLLHHIPVELLTIKLNKLTSNDLSKWKLSLIKETDDLELRRKSQSTANRVMAMLKAALNQAYQKDIIGTNKAWRPLVAFKEVKKARDVFLNKEQIQRLYKNTSSNFHNLVKSALLTGARYGEIIKPTVADFNEKEGTLKLSGKTGQRDCYLSDEAVAHFKKLSINKLPNAKLHNKDDGTDWKGKDQSTPMLNVVRAAKLPKETVFYTLRHTHISIALKAGVNILALAKNCGTSVRMIDDHYGKFVNEDRRAMFNKVEIG